VTKTNIVEKYAKAAGLPKGTTGYIVLEAAVVSAFEAAAAYIDDSTEPGPKELAAAIRALSTK
jgi:hypothetical protein